MTEKAAGVAQVDFLIDENGSRVDVPDDSTLKIATDVEQTVGATGPTNWWRIGLIGVAALALLLLIMQVMGGGQPATEMIPGTPQTAPANTVPAV